MEKAEYTKTSKTVLKNPTIWYVILFVCGLFFLDQTPVVNNDEYWFGDAANELSEGAGFNVSIYPEFYQNIKTSKIIGFSLLQSVFVSVFGFNIFSLRLLPYLCIFMAGWMLLLLAKKKSFKHAEIIPFIFVLNPYIWHVGHVGRPEAVLLFIAVTSIYVVFTGANNYKTAIILGLLFSTAYTVFILGVYISFFILVMLLFKKIKKQLNIVTFGTFIIITLIYAAVFIGLQGWDNLIKTYTGEELKASNLFGSYPAAIQFYVSAIMTNKMALTTFLPIMFLFLYWIFNQKKLVFLKSNFEIYLYIFICAIFLIYLRRTNMFYVSLLVTGMLCLLLTIQNNVTGLKKILVGVMVLNAMFVLFYSIVYPLRESAQFSTNLKKERIIAPVQWRDQLTNCDSFIALEDYKGVLKTRYMAFEDYVFKYRVNYLLLDEFTEKQWYGAEVLKLAESNGKLIDSGTMGSLGSRDYEDIPYFLSLRKAYSLMKERPKYRWKLYSINK